MWIGPVGGLLEVRSPSVSPVEHAARSSFATTLGGRVVEQRAPARGRRAWQVGFPEATRPESYTVLRALVDGALGAGPWVWVEPWAAVVNLCTPEAAWLAVGTFTTSGVALPVGPQVGADGTWLPSSLSSDGSTVWVGLPAQGEHVQVPANVQVTGSVYVSGSSVSVVLRALDAAGVTLAEAGGIEAPSGLARVARTMVTPVGTSSVMFVISGEDQTVIAGPQVTLTPTAVPWAAGEGAYRVSVDGLSVSPLIAAPDLRIGPASFLVREVG